MKLIAGALIALVAALAISAIVTFHPQETMAPDPVHTSVPTGRHYLGVSVPGEPLSMAGVRRFASATGTRPNLVSYYTPWYVAFDVAAATQVNNYGALPLIFLDSGRVPVREIAYGGGPWLAGYARAVKAFGRPVAISFDSEFNGPWWLWGYTHVSPATYVAAWHRIVNTFRAVGATNVIWIWDVAVSGPNTTALRPWWPGASYVDWVGVNGYWHHPDYTFHSIFSRTFTQVRAITQKPLLITETGANPSAERAANVAALFRGVKGTRGLIGFTWFDYDKSPTHDYRINGDVPALSVFRREARRYRLIEIKKATLAAK